MAKKTFSKKVAASVEAAAAEDVQLGELAVLFKEIPQAASGDDLIEGFLSTVSDFTAKEAPLAEFAPPEVQLSKEPDPSQLGSETNVPTDFVKKVAEIQKRTGASFEDAESIVRKQAPPPQAVTGEHYGIQREEVEPPLTDIPPASPREPLSPEQTEMNGIAAEELIEWYDAIQAGSAVWAYDYFTSPKNATKIVETLLPKITKNTANPQEREMFERAQATLLSYAKRKGLFSDSAPMSANIKSRSIRLLDKILEVRGISIPPEVLLALLLLTPVVMNLSKIWIEKSGHSGGDELFGKFEQFVTKQESEYWKEPKTDPSQP